MEPNSTFEALLSLRSDLALALRAAAAQGLSEGVCNHFSVAVPGRADWFLLNPRGLHWSEVQAPDIVMCNAARKARARSERSDNSASKVELGSKEVPPVILELSLIHI